MRVNMPHKIPSAQQKGWQSNYPFCFAIAAASEGAFNMSLWSKFPLRKIKKGGVNLPLAFTQTTNVTLRPLFPDDSLPPAFCLCRKHFAVSRNKWYSCFICIEYAMRSKNIFLRHLFKFWKWFMTADICLSPNAFIKFVSYAMRKHNWRWLLMNWQKLPWRLISLLNLRGSFESLVFILKKVDYWVIL